MKRKYEFITLHNYIESLGDKNVISLNDKSIEIEVEKYLLNQYNEIADYHKDWADEIKKRTDITADTVHNIVQEEVGHVFVRVLEDAGVYKRDEKGQKAFMRFVNSIGLE